MSASPTARSCATAKFCNEAFGDDYSATDLEGTAANSLDFVT
jgi:hypothetical protein